MKYRREYPTGDLLSEVTGYFTYAFGATKVERFYGDVLTGSTAEQQVRGLGDLLEGQIDNAGTVQLAAARGRAAGRQVPPRWPDRIDRRDGAGDRSGAGDVQQPVATTRTRSSTPNSRSPNR